MTQRELSLLRLEQLTDYYQSTGKVKAVMAFGSCGAERARFDDYSDLDFLVVCRDEEKQSLLSGLQALSALSHIEFCFINYGDAVKLMFRDGVFCDYGIVTLGQLSGIPHAEGIVLWCKEGFDTELCKSNIPSSDHLPADILVGELLTALYVGMCREKRGERLIAFQMIQVEAVNLLFRLYTIEHEPEHSTDSFSAGRRSELNFPGLTAEYPRMMQGYKKNAESALALLNCLSRFSNVNAFMAEQIRQMCIT